MSYTTSLTYVAGELVQSVDFYLGDPDRPIMPCAQDHPTMQDIIDSVRNTVDNHGNSIYQAVAVPVRNLPHDIQAIFERGGALDWVERSIDQVVFSHNIATGYRTEGMQPGVTWSSGAAPANEWNKEFKAECHFAV